MYMRYKRYIKLTTLPFDDTKAHYDLSKHRYIVELDYFKLITGIDLETELGGNTQALQFLDETSDGLYDIGYSTANYRDLDVNVQNKEYLLAKDHNIRDKFISSLITYARACIVSDIDKIGDEHGVDYEKGVRIEIKDYDDIPTQTKRKLLATGIMHDGEYMFRVENVDLRVGY